MEPIGKLCRALCLILGIGVLSVSIAKAQVPTQPTRPDTVRSVFDLPSTAPKTPLFKDAPGATKTYPSVFSRPRHANFIHAGGGFGIPSGELAARFGTYGQVQGGYTHLFPKKLTLATSFGYGFGNIIRQDPIAPLRDDIGQVPGLDGSSASIQISQRMLWLPALKFGRLFVIGKRGGPRAFEHALLPELGLQYLLFWYNIDDISKSVPLLSPQYRGGYDRANGGLAALLHLTYFLTPPRGRYSFTFRTEYAYAATRSIRAYDFALLQKDATTHRSGMLNFTLGITINLFGLDDQEFFYN
jgi:hypothetical protein